MPDFSLKFPNLTAEISWSWRINDSIEFDDIAFLPYGLSAGRRRQPLRHCTRGSYYKST